MKFGGTNYSISLDRFSVSPIICSAGTPAPPNFLTKTTTR